MNDLPQPLTPAERRNANWQLNTALRQARRARRESEAVLKALYRDGLKGRRS